MDKILKQMQQMNAELTANMNAKFDKIDSKFEQSAANDELNIAELTSKIDTQKVSLTEALENNNADINAEIKHTNKELTVKVTEIGESNKEINR